MTKESILTYLEDAKVAHTRWVHKSKLLMEGRDLDKDSIPIEPTECKFGKWLYSDGKILSTLSNNPIECMQNIEVLHNDLHATYLNIYKIYFSEKKKSSFISKLFGNTKKVISEVEKKFISSEYLKIKDISEKLLTEINRLERRLRAVSEEKISNLA